jgi:hypothetical protein
MFTSILYLVRPAWRLPFPDTRLRVVASNAGLDHFPGTRLRVVLSHAALDHFAAPVFACDDEAGEKAAAETKRAESHHDDELQWFTHRNSSGSLAMFTAIRHAWAAVRGARRQTIP